MRKKQRNFFLFVLSLTSTIFKNEKKITPVRYATYAKHWREVECMRKTYEPLFKQYGVDVAINGHDHSYDRSYPTCVFCLVSSSVYFFPLATEAVASFSFFFCYLFFCFFSVPASFPSAHNGALSHPPFCLLSRPSKKNRFNNAVDLICGTTHLTLGSGGADDLTLGYMDQVLGEKNALGYYKTQYCKKGKNIMDRGHWKRS